MQEKRIKVSVVVPVYKVEKLLLERCIESLSKQTLEEIEILLVDDGSPDNSGKICDEYALHSTKIKAIHKENGGVSSARNCGIENASGEYIGFVDADDYVKPDFFEILYNTAAENNTDMVCSGYIELKDNMETECIFSDDNSVCLMNPAEAVEEFLLFRKIDFRVWNKIFRAETAKRIRFSEEFRIAEDELFIYEFIKKSQKIQYISYAGYYYYINPDSVMSKAFSVKNLDSLKVTDIISRELDTQPAESVNYFILNTCLRLWVKIASERELSSEFSDEKIYIEKKIRRIPFSKVKFHGNKTLQILFLPMKISIGMTEFLVRRLKFISLKISL